MDYTIEDFKSKLSNDRGWARRALVVLYSFQTESEQLSQSTHDHNGAGFNSVDAYILSAFAKQLDQRGFLSPKQYDICFHKLPKYAGQLFNYSKAVNNE
jgi:hypothetical protein